MLNPLRFVVTVKKEGSAKLQLEVNKNHCIFFPKFTNSLRPLKSLWTKGVWQERHLDFTLRGMEALGGTCRLQPLVHLRQEAPESSLTLLCPAPCNALGTSCPGTHLIIMWQLSVWSLPSDGKDKSYVSAIFVQTVHPAWNIPATEYLLNKLMKTRLLLKELHMNLYCQCFSEEHIFLSERGYMWKYTTF